MSTFYASRSNKVPVRKPPTFSYDDEMDYDFVQEVMTWSHKIVKASPASGSLIALRERYETKNDALELYPKLIMEDARAVVAQGFEKQARKRCKITLLSLKEPRDSGKPWVLTFEGTIETGEDDNYLSLCVVELFKKKENKEVEVLLGVATQIRNAHNKIKVRAYIRRDIRKHKMMQPGEAWTGSYLGSVVTHDRMHSACKSMSSLGSFPLLDQVVRGTLPVYPAMFTPLVPKLNQSQSIAVHTFLLEQVKLMLLQGPPGTGKTTTIASLLKLMYANGMRTLVCAPSNKAVEVLASRFHADNISALMLLVGVEAKVKEHLAPIHLSAIMKNFAALPKDATKVIEPFLTACALEAPTSKDWQSFVPKLEAVKKTVTIAFHSLQKYTIATGKRELPLLHDQITALREKVAVYPHEASVLELQKIADGLRSFTPPEEMEFLNKAKVIFCTLSVSGRRQLLEMERPVALIVDEAGQSVEAETLIALQHRPSKVLLVGDTKQLPATVISQHAKDHHYDWSMMYRLADRCGAPMLMLEEQYRMHPTIREWPSARYYDNKLRDGVSIASRPRPAACPEWLLPIAFYDMTHTNNKEVKVGTSTANAKEAKYIAHTLQHLRQRDANGTVGIIVPYAAQVSCIENELKALKVNMHHTRISSVDGFQGDECDYIFLSFVRFGNGVGFTGDFQRLNVAVTRAKHALFMVGNVTTLQKAEEFKSLLAHLRARNLIFREEVLAATLGISAPSEPAAGTNKKNKKNKKNKGPIKASFSVAGTKNKQKRGRRGNIFVADETAIPAHVPAAAPVAAPASVLAVAPASVPASGTGTGAVVAKKQQQRGAVVIPKTAVATSGATKGGKDAKWHKKKKPAAAAKK